jgi:hypothetical protein
MDAFARFVFSIAYPPNPEEPADRVFSGTLGDPSDTFDPPDPQAGSGAQRGLKLFHILRVSSSNCSGRSCVQCHWLPEGSNNKISLFVEDSFNSNNRQPLETPTIRLLRQKEGAVIRGQPAVTVKSALFGLLSQGNVPTINDFVLGAFALGPNPPITPVQAADITRFVREVDSGVGPLVGQSYSINTANVNDTSPGGTNDTLNLWEQQSLKANHGLAVQANLTGLRRGFWFDPIPVPPVYREEPVGAVLTRSALLALVTQSTDLLVVHATPLGSERRFAWPNSGNPPPLAGLSPTNITLEPMRPNTAYAPVPQLTKNWIPVELGGDFNWTGDDPPGTALTPPFVKLVRIFQRALLNQYGLTALRHEAPRRFRVAMDNGRHGARLSLKMATDTTANSPQNSTTFLTFELPVYPTSEVNAQGRSIWETAVEADPLTLYTLMLGGPAGTKVQETLDDPFDAPEPPPANYFNPVRWNSYLVEVKNEDGTTGSGGWQPITIQ